MGNPLVNAAVGRLARGLDLAFARAALGAPGRTPRMGHAQRLRALALIEHFYSRPEFLLRCSQLLPLPAAITPSVVHRGSYGRGGEIVDLRWPSGFEPLWSEPALRALAQSLPPATLERLGGRRDVDLVQLARALGIDRSAPLRDKYLGARENQTAHARWFRHRAGGHPCALLIHGYMGGSYALEAHVWQVRRLFRAGLDVVMTVLPFHGPRRVQARGLRPPAFPSGDPRFTIEGFRQLVLEHRALMDYLRARGAVRIGVMGMSLGGYSAALLSTLESALAFAVFFVPLASIDEIALRQGRMGGHGREHERQRDALRRAQWCISPLARDSLVAPQRAVVVAGEADQVTGLDHARQLAEHFGARLSTFPGGHLLHAGRERAYAPVWRLVDEVAAV